MFDIGFMELLVLAIVGMVVIGPERLPSAARTVGKSVGKVKRFFNAMQRQIDQELKMEELNKSIMEDTKTTVFPLNNESKENDKANEPKSPE